MKKKETRIRVWQVGPDTTYYIAEKKGWFWWSAILDDWCLEYSMKAAKETIDAYLFEEKTTYVKYP